MLSNNKTIYLASLLIGISFITTSHAGDMAKLRVIGFSTNGSHFAFEQYGIQDGSGFPYSDIFIINTASDSWVSGSPIRIVSKDEFSSLSATRDTSAHRALPLLNQYNFSQPPSHQIISHSAHEPPENSRQFTIKLGENTSPATHSSGEYTIELKQWKEKNARCQRYGVIPNLFRLSITPALDSQGKTQLLHQDSYLPKSRGCPIDYDLHSIHISTHNKEKSTAIAVIINVYLKGYEGHNQRFLAITALLNKI